MANNVEIAQVEDESTIFLCSTTRRFSIIGIFSSSRGFPMIFIVAALHYGLAELTDWFSVHSKSNENTNNFAMMHFFYGGDVLAN